METWLYGAGGLKARRTRLVWAFNQSLGFDRRMWREDIAGSVAHAKMLAKQGIISRTTKARR